MKKVFLLLGGLTLLFISCNKELNKSPQSNQSNVEMDADLKLLTDDLKAAKAQSTQNLKTNTPLINPDNPYDTYASSIHDAFVYTNGLGLTADNNGFEAMQLWFYNFKQRLATTFPGDDGSGANELTSFEANVLRRFNENVQGTHNIDIYLLQAQIIERFALENPNITENGRKVILTSVSVQKGLHFSLMEEGIEINGFDFTTGATNFQNWCEIFDQCFQRALNAQGGPLAQYLYFITGNFVVGVIECSAFASGLIANPY